MRKIILPIKPKYVEKILCGQKIVEYRTWVPSCTLPFIVYIYATNPIGKVVGCFSVYSILKDSPESLWVKTENMGGIDLKSFFKYFRNRSVGYAFEISNLKKFAIEKSISEFGLSSVPQRFCYVD